MTFGHRFWGLWEVQAASDLLDTLSVVVTLRLPSDYCTVLICSWA